MSDLQGEEFEIINVKNINNNCLKTSHIYMHTSCKACITLYRVVFCGVYVTVVHVS